MAFTIYFLFSTILLDATIVGSFGHDIGALSRNVFGLLAYPMYLVAIFLLYKAYRHTLRSLRTLEVTVAALLLFFSFLILQALLLPLGVDGSFGRGFISFTAPFIGVFGIWVFWLMTTVMATIMMKDITLAQLLQLLKLADNKLFTFKGRAPKAEKPAKVAKEKTIEKDEKSEKERLIITSSEEDSLRPQTLSEQSLDESTATTTLEDKLNNILPEEGDTNFTIKLKSNESEVQPKKEKQTSRAKEILPVKEDVIAPSNELIHDEAIDETVNASEILSQMHEDTTSAAVSQTPIADEHLHKAVIVDELEENKRLLDEIEQGDIEKPKGFTLPPLDMLALPDQKDRKINEDHLDEKIGNLLDKLNNFKIEGDVVRTYTGPVVSTFEFKPAPHIKVSKILTLQDDLAMALRAKTIRIQAPVPGKDVVGIEIPNEEVETIYLRQILDSELFQKASSPLTIVLGQDIVGKPFITDLKKLPHLLIAGTTGSGKSVGINAMILSLLYRNSPDQLRFLMIDPKMLEFSIYNDIPHLLTPVITKPKQAISALNNMVSEMERRYTMMSETKTKNIDTFNEKAAKEGRDKLPFIVVIIDELADLMMTSGKEVEYSVARLAQMARASGIHLIVATQRPSVDVVTGLIKANLPSRISYKVGQKIDSKVILDSMGAESLLGRGDMLFTPPGGGGLVRLHAPWSSEDEIENIVNFIKAQRTVDYDEKYLVKSEGGVGDDADYGEDLDPLYEQAKEIVYGDQKTSISYLQRRLQIGYNKAARIIEQLEATGVLSEPNAKGIREIL
ncbi:MAG: DNA translocase FtsK [Thiovulaceae bacterium]|nr:DNA translocase FtsK [Sulfurimonadaceae bacterium]